MSEKNRNNGRVPTYKKPQRSNNITQRNNNNAPQPQQETQQEQYQNEQHYVPDNTYNQPRNATSDFSGHVQPPTEIGQNIREEIREEQHKERIKNIQEMRDGRYSQPVNISSNRSQKRQRATEHNDVMEKFNKTMSQLDGYAKHTHFVRLMQNKYPIYPMGHPLRDTNDIEIKYISTKEEDIISNTALLSKGKFQKRLAESLIVDSSINVRTLAYEDLNRIISSARIENYGKEYPVSSLECPYCKKDYEDLKKKKAKTSQMKEEDLKKIDKKILDEIKKKEIKYKFEHNFDLTEINKEENFEEELEKVLAENPDIYTTDDGTVVIPIKDIEVEIRKYLTVEQFENLVVTLKYLTEEDKLEEYSDKLTVYRNIIVSINGVPNRDEFSELIDKFLTTMESRYTDRIFEIFKKIVVKAKNHEIVYCPYCTKSFKADFEYTHEFFWSK